MNLDDRTLLDKDQHSQQSDIQDMMFDEYRDKE